MNFRKLFLVLTLMVFIFTGNFSSNRTEIIDLPQYVKEDAVLERERNHLIKLDGASNVRDLGGYKTQNGNITKTKTFIRSDDTDELTENDIKILAALGVSDVIDLRDETAAKKWPDKLANDENFNYHRITIPEAHRVSKGNYVKYLEYTGDGNIFKKFFDIAVQAEGAVLFHCVGGKDRTGVFSLILLLLANVDLRTIIENYVVSYDFIKDRPKIKLIIENDVRALGESCLEPLHFSMEKNIISLINFIQSNYKNVEEFLITCGISKQNIEKVKAKFIV